MTTNIGGNFFACGYVSNQSAVEVKKRILKKGDRVRIVPHEGNGFSFFTVPFYVDVAERDEFIGIKLGCVHDGYRLLSTDELIRRGWVGPRDVQADRIRGSSTIVVLQLREPHILFYRSLLSPAVINYLSTDEGFLAADNLRSLMDLMDHPQVAEEILPQHFLFRSVYGRQTYLRGVSQLLVGERLTWVPKGHRVKLARSLRDLTPSGATEACKRGHGGLVLDRGKPRDRCLPCARAALLGHDAVGWS